MSAEIAEIDERDISSAARDKPSVLETHCNDSNIYVCMSFSGQIGAADV